MGRKEGKKGATEAKGTRKTECKKIDEDPNLEENTTKGIKAVPGKFFLLQTLTIVCNQ